MEIIAVILGAVNLLLLVLILVKHGGEKDDSRLEKLISDEQRSLRSELTQNVRSSVKEMGDLISNNQQSAARIQQDSITAQLKQLEERIKTLELNNEQKLGSMRETIALSLNNIREDNNKRLADMQATVDEKLQKSLEEKLSSSFRIVSERLEQVYKGLGEMQTIAVGVGDLKKVLSNVKTRGILGEIQLGAILSEILTPDQYETETVTVPNSREYVEFAVKLPAADDGYIYLPIDSKFPGDTFAALQDAYSGGNADEIKSAYKQLESVIKKCAKDIRDKYICPPYTTSFAIMFLPFEGLYAEAVNHGLVEVLQREYSVNIAGPSTMAAMLNSLQMGFQTLRIQKHSNEVWDILGAVKTEFETFEKVFESAKTRIRQLDEELDKLVGVRTRAIRRKLRSVHAAENGLELPE